MLTHPSLLLAQAAGGVAAHGGTGHFNWATLLLLAWMVVTVGGVVVIRLLHRPTPNPGGADGVCGSCGYSVSGLEALRCPECGADLRKAGIVKPGGTWSLRFKINVYLGVCLGVLVLGTLLLVA